MCFTFDLLCSIWELFTLFRVLKTNNRPYVLSSSMFMNNLASALTYTVVRRLLLIKVLLSNYFTNI